VQLSSADTGTGRVAAVNDCAIAFSQHPVPAAAVGEVIGGVLERIDPHPDLAVVFASGPHADDFEAAVLAIESLLAPETIIGTTAPIIFGGSLDAPVSSGISLLAVHRPGLVPFRLDAIDEGVAQVVQQAQPGSTALVLGAPDFDRHGRLPQRIGPVSPGMVGARHLPRAHPRLLLDGGYYSDGAVGVLFAPGSASAHQLGVATDADGAETWPDGLVGLGDSPGLLLFADLEVNMVDGPSLDFEMIAERFGGSLVGMVGVSLLYPEPARAGGPGPRATALVIDPVEG
jgi:hypothetical protein